MPDVILTCYRIADGQTDRLREWMAELRNRRPEARETLRDEGVHTESAVLERRDDGDYLRYYVECEDVDAMWAAFQDSDHHIDRGHAAVMDAVLADDGDEPETELLYHLVTPERPGGGSGSHDGDGV